MEVEFDLTLEDRLDLLDGYLLRTYYVLGTGHSMLSKTVSVLLDLTI